MTTAKEYLERKEDEVKMHTKQKGEKRLRERDVIVHSVEGRRRRKSKNKERGRRFLTSLEGCFKNVIHNDAQCSFSLKKG